MIINNKLRTLFVLALHIGFTIAIYAIVCHFLKIEFQDIHLLYAILVGCVAYLPRFIAERKVKSKRISKGKRMLYYFSICASSAFIVFPNTGCTSSGAISVKGRITKSRSAIKGWGRLSAAPEGEVTESIRSS